MRLETIARATIEGFGLFIAVVVRPRAGRILVRAPGTIALVITATVLGLAASELTIRHVQLRPGEWLLADEEPRRQPDARLGWTFAPARDGRKIVNGRTIDYAMDPAGYRVRRVDEPVDPARATIVFTGESVMCGEGLTWEESIPAQVAAMTGIQSADLAVHGYSNDQAYLRLQTELPRFRHPVAVVSIFMTTLFGRNLDDDRPHLGPGLVWESSVPRWRLTAIGKLFFPYRSDAAVERGIAVTRAVFGATADLARARGAVPLLVVPQFAPEDGPEEALRRRVLDDTGLPYVMVQLDPAWRLPLDQHPDARAAHAIAEAVAGRLRMH